MAVIAFDGYNIESNEDSYKTITAGRNDTHNLPVVCYAVGGPRNGFYETEQARTLDIACGNPGCNQGGTIVLQPSVCYGISRSMLKGGENGGGIPMGENLQPGITANGCGAVCFPKVTGSLCAAGYSKLGLQEAANNMYVVLQNWDGSQITPTLTANNAGGNQRMPDKENFNAVIERKEQKFVLRRLTPLECARLQGFPDWWTDGTDGSDSAKYKMWGNGIALPCAADVIGRIAKEMGRDSDDIALEG